MEKICIYGIKTSLIYPNDSIEDIFFKSLNNESFILNEGDVIVVAESALATSQGRIVDLSEVIPGNEAKKFEKSCGIDAREAELIIQEADEIFGCVYGALLTLKNGILCPNAGIDNSNAPSGCVVLYPEDPDLWAQNFVKKIKNKFGINVGVIVADSRTQPLRLGCSGIALGAAGFKAVLDMRGKKDVYSRELTITRIAVADNIATAAEIIMGEADECTPFAVVRGVGVQLEPEQKGIEKIPMNECMYFGSNIIKK